MQGALLGNLDKNKMVIRVESLTGQSSGQQLVSLTPPTPSFSQIRPQTRGTLLLFNFISLISSKKIITRADLGEIFEGRLKGERAPVVQVPRGRAWPRAGKHRGASLSSGRGFPRQEPGCSSAGPFPSARAARSAAPQRRSCLPACPASRCCIISRGQFIL